MDEAAPTEADIPDAIHDAWLDIDELMKSEEPLSCDLMAKLNKFTKAVAAELDLQDENALAFEPNVRFSHLAEPQKFDARFEYFQPLFETYKQAYFAVECEHYLCYGKNKYANYESFRKSRGYRLKNKEKE